MTFLKAEWRWLAMLNYACDPALLSKYVPVGTELDSWNGRTYVSIVGFLFLNTRVCGVPIPLHRDFEEVNLRFYVRHKGPEGWRRGVAFIKELVPRRAIAAVARQVYGENYQRVAMRHSVTPPTQGSGGLVEYEWDVNGAWNRIRATFSGDPAPLTPGLEPEFIAEHYWGYVRRFNTTLEYRVEHPSWRVWQADNAELICDAETLYGRDFVDALSQSPTSAFIADGSAISVLMGKPIGSESAA